MLAGLAVAIAQGALLEHVIRLGIAADAVMGGDASFGSARDVQAFLPEIDVASVPFAS